MARPITEEEKQTAQALLTRARAAQKLIEDYDQATIQGDSSGGVGHGQRENLYPTRPNGCG